VKKLIKHKGTKAQRKREEGNKLLISHPHYPLQITNYPKSI